MHPLDECNAVLFIEDDDLYDAYDSDDWPRTWRDGPIVVVWNGDGYSWHYPVSP